MAVLTCTHNQCFEQNKKKVKHFQMKIVIFTSMKNRCMLHRRVFVMNIDREFTYLNKLVCVGPVGVSKKVFLAVVAGNVTTYYRIFTHSAPGLY